MIDLVALADEIGDIEITPQGASLPCPVHGKPMALKVAGDYVTGETPECGCSLDALLARYAQLSPKLAGWLQKHNSNGNETAAGSQPERRPNVFEWQNVLYELGRRGIEQIITDNPDGRALIAAQPLEAFVETVQKLRNYPGIWQARDFDHNESDIDKEVENVALALMKRYGANGHLPATVDPYADRHAIDAYEAFTISRAEVRQYAWEGLLREGCTLVMTGLMGSGKSTLAMNVARGWALEMPVLDRTCKQSRTLAIVSPKEYEAWIETIGFWQLQQSIFIIESSKAHFGKPTECARWFVAEMERWSCKTFVLDTLFDFFGMPPNNSGDQNRIVMNEQTPFLEAVRAHLYAGIVTGHPPKSEANAITPRDPEESFGGHTAWAAQHRMRMTIRRKAQGVNAILTGRGGYGDQGILEEHMLLFDADTRLDSLGGLFSQHLGEAALPSVLEILQQLDKPVALSTICREMQKGEKWVRPGLKEGRKTGKVVMEGKGKATKYRLAGPYDNGVPEDPEEGWK